MFMISAAKVRILALAAAFAVAGCMGEDTSGSKHLRPLSYATLAQLDAKGMSKESELLIRIYKEEDELEVWKKGRDGRFAHFKTYDICKWSGDLGPKIKEGDRQAPEGFYTVTPAQMNPNSSYHLSFNLGYPNTFDRAHGRTGQHLMVHGACSSAGCYAMTDDVIQEIYSLARESFRGGQRSFQVQALPFRMTPANMARHADNPNMPFWRNLKEGVDHFEVTGVAPEIGVCERRYVFNARPSSGRLDPLSVCPVLNVPSEIETAVAAKQMRDETAFQMALADIRSQTDTRTVADISPIMLASADLEEGSADGYPVGTPATVAAGLGAAPQAATGATEPSGEPIATASIPRSPQLGEAVSGVWSRIVGFARIDNWGQQGMLAAPSPELDEEEAATAPTPDRNASATDALPALSSANAFAPRLYAADPFSVFGLFETVDGVSVPADTIRR